jgi:aldehyde dehydrogenase
MDVLANDSLKKADLFQSEYGLFINGQWRSSSSGEVISQINPATGQKLADIQKGTVQDAVAAVEAAAAAFPKWSRSSLEFRNKILLEIARRLHERAPDFALMETLNNGKTITESTRWDLPQAETLFRYFGGLVHTIGGETRNYPDKIEIVHREALGVCVQITPWNVPLLMAATKIAPALAAGNTIVLKPAETTCLSVLEFVRLIEDLLPPGVLNVVTGYGADLGEALVTHPAVRKVAFTGSTATGRRIMEYASKNIIPQTLELGGKSAQIICPSADIDAAVEGAMMSTVFNKGEVCFAGSRLFVHESVKEEFATKLAASMKRVQVGDPTDPATRLGAQASKVQYEKVLEHIRVAIEEGAEPLAGGKAATVAGFGDGFFIQPTLFDNVNQSMHIAREEIFGPVSTLHTWRDEDEMLSRVNDTPYGLGGGIWSRDLGETHRLSRLIETGTIWVNRYYNVEIGMPVGGYKQSGFGREFSREILDAYTQTKTVVINLDEGPLGVF